MVYAAYEYEPLPVLSQVYIKDFLGFRFLGSIGSGRTDRI